MAVTRAIYKNLLIAAIAIFVAGTCYMFCNIYTRLCEAEHDLACMHLQGAGGCYKDGMHKHSVADEK